MVESLSDKKGLIVLVRLVEAVVKKPFILNGSFTTTFNTPFNLMPFNSMPFNSPPVLLCNMYYIIVVNAIFRLMINNDHLK